MKKIKGICRRFAREEDGPTAAEYAVMLAMIVLACLVAINTLSDKIQTTFLTVTSILPDGTSPG